MCVTLIVLLCTKSCFFVILQLRPRRAACKVVASYANFLRGLCLMLGNVYFAILFIVLISMCTLAPAGRVSVSHFTEEPTTGLYK